MNTTEITENYLNNINNIDTCRLAEMRAYALKHNVPIICPQTAGLLCAVIRILNPKNILEIGTAIGYSGILMLQNSSAHLTTIDNNERCIKIAKQNFDNDRVAMHTGDAKNVLENLAKENRAFDFIFLDGPKVKYLQYLPLIMGLLNIGGVLFADNVLFKGLVAGEDTNSALLTITRGQGVCHEGAADMIDPKKKKTITDGLREFNRQIANDKRLKTSILNVGDGVSVSIKITG